MMANKIVPGDIEYFYFELDFTEEEVDLLCERFPFTHIYQSNKAGEFSIRKTTAFLLISRETFWRTALKAAVTGEACVQTGYDDNEKVVFRVIKK